MSGNVVFVARSADGGGLRAFSDKAIEYAPALPLAEATYGDDLRSPAFQALRCPIS